MANAPLKSTFESLDILYLTKLPTGSLPVANASNEGSIVYDDTANTFKYSNGSAWVEPGGSSDVTLAPVGTAPAAEGASLSGQVLTLQPASSTMPGLLSILAQTIAGEKTWLAAAVFAAGVTMQSTLDVTGVGVTAAGWRAGTSANDLWLVQHFTRPTGVYAAGSGTTLRLLANGTQLDIGAAGGIQTPVKLNSSVATGFDAVKLLDGARLNFSTADASAYLYRSATDTIATPGALTVDGVVTSPGFKASAGTAAGVANGLYLQSGNSPAIASNSTLRLEINDIYIQGAAGSPFSSLVTSGNSAFKLLDGAQLNFSTADASAYLYRSAANAIATPANLILEPTIDTPALTFKATGEVDTEANFASVSGGIGLRYGSSLYWHTNYAAGTLINNYGFDSQIASGSISYSMLDGARLNFSTADANCYLYRSAADTITSQASFHSEGNLRTGASGSLSVGTAGLGVTGSTSIMSIATGWDLSDLAATEAIRLLSSTAFTNLEATAVSVRNATDYTPAPVLRIRVSGRVDQSGTDSSDTPGPVTINKPSGKSAIATGDNSVVITNSLVAATSRVMITPNTRDATCKELIVVPAAGSFTVSGSDVAANDLSFSWEVAGIL